MNSIERQRRRRWLAARESRLANQPTPDAADKALREHIAMQLVGYRIVVARVSDVQLVERMGRMKRPEPKQWRKRKVREAYKRKARQMAQLLDSTLSGDDVRLSTWQRYARAVGLKVNVPMPQLPPPPPSVRELQRTLRSRHRRWQRQRFRPRLAL